MSVWAFILGEGLRGSDYDRISREASNFAFDIGMFEALGGFDPDQNNRGPLVSVIRRLELQDLAIAHSGHHEPRDFEVWSQYELEPEGVQWAWLDPQFQRPPLAVAAALDRLRAAVERGDPDIRPFLLRYGVEEKVNPATCESQTSFSARKLERFIEELDALAKICRMMADMGVKRVTFTAEPL